MIVVPLIAILGLGNASAGGLTVDVQVIEASNLGNPEGGQSKAIRDLGATLSYKNFQTLSHDEQTLSIGEQMQLALPDGAVAHIFALGVEGDKKKPTLRLRVRVEQGKEALDTEYSVRNGGTVFVSAGKGKSPDSVLVLAIAPRLK
jgi:hypothetical protein